MSDTDGSTPDDLRGFYDTGTNEPAGEGVSEENDPEFVRLDQLYQQALQAVEAVEAGLEHVESGAQNSQKNAPHTALSTPHSARPAPNLTVSPRQIIEAALFVGGRPLTSKALCSLLRGDFDQAFVEATIDELNAQYAGENRPYTIQFGEGGYRMTLRPEFERLRNRVYGLGPKEVKLSQEALEVLALVAYKQPITRQEIEELGKPNAGGLLRQLLRRELIALHRDEDDPQTVTYQTTQRFLDLFGIGRLEELPQADELSFK